MANWSRRVSELVEENKDITDDMFFSSQEYTEFTRQQAEDMISGVCHYLRRQGFHITETMENERLRMFDLDVIFSESDDLTAATDGTHVVINAGSTLLKMFEKHRELRHY